VITRFLKWFEDFGIPPWGHPGERTPAALGGGIEPEFITNRRAMQAEHMETIWRLFDGQVRTLVPRFDTEIRGIPALERLSEVVFA
jgi:anion-transporting  ArsA/GET3 family ATPase